LKKVPLENLEIGMRLAKDVFLEDGRILLLAGFILKPRYIAKLISFNIDHVYILEEETSPTFNVSEERAYIEAFNTIKEVMDSIQKGEDINVEAVSESVNDIVVRVMNNEPVFMQLTGMRDIDNYTFLHSVDVCVYSVITGKAMGMNSDELLDLGMGAILHDIGKCKVAPHIINKPAKLTDSEFQDITHHTIYGYDIISHTPGLNKNIAEIACQHHEKWDGSGYPFGLKDYDITLHARIIAVADIYDALTSDRVYKKRDLPHIAAEYLITHSNVLFDPKVIDVFIKTVAIYPVGSVVLLNSGEIAKVISSEFNISTRPTVEVIARKEGPPVLKPYKVDLAQNHTVFITELYC
jgi:HD-GYP domain-containing protein (c-di-GMP phosphodiesterase class II)